jgi:hypothetical protein
MRFIFLNNHIIDYLVNLVGDKFLWIIQPYRSLELSPADYYFWEALRGYIYIYKYNSVS